MLSLVAMHGKCYLGSEEGRRQIGNSTGLPVSMVFETEAA